MQSKQHKNKQTNDVYDIILLPWRSDKLLPLQFSDDSKVIVFVSSCEAVEFLHTLFTSVLSNQQLRFLRLHGNMKQEVTPTSLSLLFIRVFVYSECLFVHLFVYLFSVCLFWMFVLCVCLFRVFVLSVCLFRVFVYSECLFVYLFSVCYSGCLFVQSVCLFIVSVCLVHQERSEVFEEFSVSGSGVLLCTVGDAPDTHLIHSSGSGSGSDPSLFQDVAARGLDLQQVTWIIQVNTWTRTVTVGLLNIFLWCHRFLCYFSFQLAFSCI